MCENLPRRGWLGFCSKAACRFDVLAEANSFRGFQSDWHLRVFWRSHGLACRSDTDLAQLFSRSSVGLERAGIPPLARFDSAAGVAFLVLGAVLVTRLVPSSVLGPGLGSCPCRSQDRGVRGERYPGRPGSGQVRTLSAGRLLERIAPGEPVSLRDPWRRESCLRYFTSLDFTPEKCEHFSLLGSKIHT